ncbi:hypothetical protein GOV08_01995 [Candidatus Woesearchaeota archaeon]|nr:hypothetical protein [Candidatus Woesearchaeota archaeon]
MTFENDKKKYLAALYKPDNSKKGNVDLQIKELIDKINSKNNYYTTSSCAGRIVLIMIPKSGRKDHAKWLFTTHDKVSPKDLPLDDFPQDTVWFRQEGAVLHVCCKTVSAAQILVNKAKTAGFKRSGIMATKKRVMIEISSTESIDAPISKDGRLLVDKNYINILVNEANKKLKRNGEKAKKFLESL